MSSQCRETKDDEDPHIRLAIMLAMRSDLTYQEIARLLGAPERDVLQAIQSGLRCLAAELTRQPTPVE